MDNPLKTCRKTFDPARLILSEEESTPMTGRKTFDPAKIVFSEEGSCSKTEIRPKECTSSESSTRQFADYDENSIAFHKGSELGRKIIRGIFRVIFGLK